MWDSEEMQERLDEYRRDIASRAPVMPSVKCIRVVDEKYSGSELVDTRERVRGWFEVERNDPSFPYDSASELFAALLCMGLTVKEYRLTGTMPPRGKIMADDAQNLARMHDRMENRVHERERRLIRLEPIQPRVSILFLAEWIRDVDSARYLIERESLIRQTLRSDIIASHMAGCAPDVQAIWKDWQSLYQ